jgi:MoaA/NifB/PqqE/SkfB family radical SAM enzyme
VSACLDLLRERRVPAYFISNGGVMTDAMAERLATYAPLGVQITLNGPDAALHEAHVGPGHFEKTLRGIGSLRLAGVSVVGCIVVTKKNAARVGEILDLWRALGVTSVALSRFSPAGYAARDVAQLLPSRKDLVTAFEQADPRGRDAMTLTCTMPVPPCAVETERFTGIRFGVCPIGRSCKTWHSAPTVSSVTVRFASQSAASKTSPTPASISPSSCATATSRNIAARHRLRKGCIHEQTCAGG